MINQINQLEELFPDMIHWRRYLHEHPELSFHEVKTADFIANCLTEWGIEVHRDFAGHSVCGYIRGELPGGKVALRADIDALPIQDEKTCEYRSKVPGVMHACGHDAHTAILLALARWFSERRKELHGTIVCVFQHAEELSPGGAASVLASGVLDQVEAIYGVHLWTPLPIGHVYGTSGAAMAAADEFRINITGKGGHGGLPHETVDSIVVAAHTVTALQTIVSRNLNPISPCVISLGVIKAGSAFNVIAEQCTMIGTVRTLDEHTRTIAQTRLREIVELTASTYGAASSVTYMTGYPSLVNDSLEVDRFFKVATQRFGTEFVHRLEPIMASEDFAYYLQQLPGCFLFVGAGNESQGIVYPHHHPKFDIDEKAMLNAAILLAEMALNRLTAG